MNTEIKRKSELDKKIDTSLINNTNLIKIGEARQADELEYDDEFSMNNITNYDKIKYLIKKKIEVYNLINLMKKEERKKHLEKFVLFDNYLIHGVLLIGLKEPDSPNKILTKTEEVIKLKQKMKMNIILTIITIEMQELFILQQAFLKKKDVKDSFYHDFDFYRQWMFFCVCIYDKIIQTHKNNGIVKKEDIFLILENVKQNNVDFISELNKQIGVQPVLSVVEKPGMIDSAVNKVKLWNQKFKGFLVASKTKISDMKTNLKTKILSTIGITEKKTLETTNDCVKKLLVDFMYILYLYEFNIDEFPLTININNPGDSTTLQTYFDDVVKQQRNYYENKFDDIIKIEHLKAETFNIEDQMNILERTNKFQEDVNASKAKMDIMRTATKTVSVGGRSRSRSRSHSRSRSRSRHTTKRTHTKRKTVF